MTMYKVTQCHEGNIRVTLRTPRKKGEVKEIQGDSIFFSKTQ